MRAICKGTLSFELITIDIELVSKKRNGIQCKFLHNQCLYPVNPFSRFCDRCKYKVKYYELVKGIKLPNDEDYLIVNAFEEVINRSMISYLKNIKIIDFLDSSLIEPHLYTNYYYAFPEDLLNDSYFLLSEFLQKHSRVAIGTFIVEDSNYFVSIQPHSDGLSFNTLNQTYYECQLKNYIIELNKIL